jgi:triosephosphate isomerase
MNHNHLEALQTVQKLSYQLGPADYQTTDVSVHPPFTDLRTVQLGLQEDRIPINLGAQNCHWETNGAFTGEVSPAFLAKLDVRLVIVGHSERRELFGETDEQVARKVKAVLAHDMVPILCVGETLEEREAGETEAKVVAQVRADLVGLSAEQVAGLVIAYEPIWAIGTGRTATPEDAQTVCGLVRTQVADLFDAATADQTRVQYGGSVKPDNITDLMGQPDIDGALVGGASLEPDVFARIVKFGSAE